MVCSKKKVYLVSVDQVARVGWQVLLAETLPLLTCYDLPYFLAGSLLLRIVCILHGSGPT